MKLILKTSSLRAACLVAPTKDIRPYLKGVHLTTRGDELRMRATDGMVLFEDVMPEQLIDGVVDIIIPIKSAKLIAKSKADAVALCKMPDGRWECSGAVFAPIDGLFPDVERVMPARTDLQPPVPQQFDCELLALAQKAMRTATGLSRAYFRLQHSSPALMHREHNAFPRCAISPLRVPKAFENN